MNVLKVSVSRHQAEPPHGPALDAYEAFLLALAVSDLLTRLFWPRRHGKAVAVDSDPFPGMTPETCDRLEKHLVSGVSL